MPVDFAEVERLLPLVAKPGRYVGGEQNIVIKNDARVDTRVALVFPDVYELGMSYLGFQILYHLLNREEWLAAERVYAPWSDMEDLMRARGIPLYSLETRRSLKEFDVIGFTLQYELHYTNVLNLMDLGGLPVRSEDRSDALPLVLAGGPCAFNPEPLAPFVDAFLLGDAEEAAFEILRLVRIAKHERYDKETLLRELAGIRGVYVPSLYVDIRDPQGRLQSVEPIEEGVPRVVEGRVVEDLRPEFYTDHPLVPLLETTHDRLSVEIMRGCTRGCRFCQAGIVYRPVRERSVEDLVGHIKRALDATGYDEVSLVSLSTSDYSQLHQLLATLSVTLRERMVNFSFPSLRPETFTPEIAAYARNVRKSGLTLAPEAGTERLRNVINKTNTNEDLLRAVDLAFREGWSLVKLYFMIGQPTETKEDLQGIVDLVHEVVRIGRKYPGQRRVNVSVSPFVPKAHTPFQWERQASSEEIREKLRYLLDRIRWPNVKVSWREPEVCQVEALLSRGDRRVADVVERVWRAGAKHDAWNEHFRFALWQKAVEESHLSFDEFTRAFDRDEVLPWQHITKGVTTQFLKRERSKAYRGKTTEDCKTGVCNACGLMDHKVCREIIARSKKSRHTAEERSPAAPTVPEPKPGTSASLFGRGKKKIRDTAPPTPVVYRLRYRRGDEVRFIGHLDMVRAFERAFRRARLPLAYSHGFNPRPKVSYGPALPVGMTSDAEYLDVTFETRPAGDIRVSVNRFLPEGVEITETRRLAGKTRALTALIDRIEYTVDFGKPHDVRDLRQRILAFLAKREIIVERRKTDPKRGEKISEVNIRSFVESIETASKGRGLRVLTRVVEGRTARMDEILQVLLDEPREKVLLYKIRRTGMFIRRGMDLVTPMET